MEKAITYSVVLYPSMVEHLRKKAKGQDRSVSAVVRGLVKDDMEKEKRNGL